MPYRRLPNTDNARLNALKSALSKGKDLPPFKLAFTQNSFQRLQALLLSYETTISEQRNSYALQLEKNKVFHIKLKKARLYISHFIQVVNMAINRGELKPNTLEYFGLQDYDKKLPSLANEDEILEWGQKLLDGEYNRRMKGLNPITNPTIAIVKVHYDQFVDAYNNQKHSMKRTTMAQEKLARKREEADLLIQQIWNEVEGSYNSLPEELRREKSADYGINYVFRKNELQDQNLFAQSRAGYR